MSNFQRMLMAAAGASSGTGLYVWGLNTSGQLGLGDVVNRSSPVQLGSGNEYSKISAGTAQTLAIKTDGTLWAWGSNNVGELGLGDIAGRSSPVQVGSLSNWSQVSTGLDHSLAVKTDGTLWAWGTGGNGRLGSGNTTSRSSPIQIGSLTDWSRVFAGAFHSLAIKTDATLWAWGLNTSGQLGLGTASSVSSPVQVGSEISWVADTEACSAGGLHSLGRRSPLLGYAWGANNRGQLGQGDVVARSSPTILGSNVFEKLVAANEHSLAILYNGTLYAWGINTSGQLGLGDVTNRSNPVQVGALTSWSNFSAGCEGSHAVAIQTDGTLWAWGLNTSGQLGQNNVVNRSSPVQISGGWAKVWAGASHSLGLKS